MNIAQILELANVLPLCGKKISLDINNVLALYRCTWIYINASRVLQVRP
jgi:hypothetical protein